MHVPMALPPYPQVTSEGADSTMTNVVKWAAAFAAVAGMAFGLIGNDDGTSAHASPPDDDHGDDHGGLIWEPGDSNVYIAETPEVQAILDGTAIRPQAAMDIVVTYTGAWPTEAQTALERAVTIWESVVAGTIPIVIDASIDNTLSSIGQGGPNLARDFPNAPKPSTWYPVALANQLRGSDGNAATAEITLKMRLTGMNWHYGAGQAPAGTTDFTSVALHEIGHGLGFTDTFTCVPNVAPCAAQITFGLGREPNNFPAVHDSFAILNQGSVPLITLAKLSAALKTAVTGSGVYFSGAFAKTMNNNNAPRLYAPNPFTGANVSHLDENTYNGTVNSLMTPVFQGNETIREPGPITRGMLKDYGYTITEIAPSTGTIQFLQTGTSVAD